MNKKFNMKNIIIIIMALVSQSCMWRLVSQSSVPQYYMVYDFSDGEVKIDGFKRMPKKRLATEETWTYYRIPFSVKGVTLVVHKNGKASTLKIGEYAMSNLSKHRGSWHVEKVLTVDGRIIDFKSRVGDSFYEGVLVRSKRAQFNE